jgi:hypothetical protein
MAAPKILEVETLTNSSIRKAFTNRELSSPFLSLTGLATKPRSGKTSSTRKSCPTWPPSETFATSF